MLEFDWWYSALRNVKNRKEKKAFKHLMQLRWHNVPGAEIKILQSVYCWDLYRVKC